MDAELQPEGCLRLSGVGGEEDCTWVTSWVFPCFILWCCLSPLSEEFVYLQCSQENEEPAATEESTVEGACLFLLRNSILRLAFLLCVEGLSFFLSTGSAASALLLVSKEKEKLVPMFREKWKVLPWVASAWQNSMHLE